MDRAEFGTAGRSPRQTPGMVSPTAAAIQAPASYSGVVALQAALQAALQTQLQAQLLGKSPDQELRRTIRLLCEDAHRQHVQVEHVIVVLKQVWYSLPEVRQLPSGGIAADLLSGVVSLTINEYYAARG